jgi:two-component system, cell cycle response regulator DivK
VTGNGLVLIIEDNPRNLKLARDVLNHAGYETLEAMNAEDGLALARARLPGVVLMDVQLPDMDGVQALGRLRSDPVTRDIPVVAVTAFAMSDDRRRLLAAGFDHYVEKPLDIREFPRQVAAALAGAGANG